MTNAIKLILGVLVLVALFVIGTSWSSHYGAGPIGTGASAVAGTSTNASLPGSGY